MTQKTARPMVRLLVLKFAILRRMFVLRHGFLRKIVALQQL
jgi:hypothetical protein